MTGRLHSLTVVLEEDVREDDAATMIELIRHIRGVLTVSGNVADASDYVAQARARLHFRDKLLALLEE